VSAVVTLGGAATGRITAMWVTRHNLQLIGGIAPLILNIGTGLVQMVILQYYCFARREAKSSLKLL
jgi:hypothetical protein